MIFFHSNENKNKDDYDDDDDSDQKVVRLYQCAKSKNKDRKENAIKKSANISR